MDYPYGAWGTWSFVFELARSFGPPASEIIPTAIEIGGALRMLTTWVLDCNGDGTPNGDEIAGGLDTDCNSNHTPDGCEVDLDSDGLIDGCDPDIDDDGVFNETDTCLFRPLIGRANRNGQPIYDVSPVTCTVDWDDYYQITTYACWISGGPGEYVGRWCEQVIDTDGDLDVDLKDFPVLQRAFDPTSASSTRHAISLGATSSSPTS